MNKDKLRQYNDLKAEIKELNKRKEEVENKKMKVVKDSVEGSNHYFPYEPRTFKIEGYNTKDVDELNKLKFLLSRRREKCESMKVDIEEFISDIDDSLTRQVFQYRYIDNLSWQAIATRIGKVYESYPRKEIHDKYLDSLE